MKIQVEMEVKTPAVPKTLTTPSGKRIPIKALTADQIKAVGHEFTQEMLKAAGHGESRTE